jgi:transcriptional regulator with XRE-family HTH domain
MLKKNLRFYRKRAKMTQSELAEAIGVGLSTIIRWEGLKNKEQPRTSDFKRICAVFGVSEAELLNGPAEKGIEIRIVIRDSDEEVGKVTMDMSKDAPFLQLVEIGPHKTGLNLVFSPEKTLREVCEELLAQEAKIDAARAAVYGA